MRLRAKEVNEKQKKSVPCQGWVARLYLWACERLYHQLAGYYDVVSWLVSAGQWRRWQRGVWKEVTGSHVLELGCGTGTLMAQGAERGVHMVGLDRSPAMLAVAATRRAVAHSDSKLVIGDGRLLPFAPAQFDTVFATFPAGYILEAATLAEVKRVLRADGRFVMLGLWVEMRSGGLARLIPVFYGKPSKGRLNSLVRRVNVAGFQSRWEEQRHGLFTVGVLIAEREQADHE